MDIKLEETGKSGSFYIGKYNDKLAEINWRTFDGYITVYETRVDDSLKRQGYGLKLFDKVVEYARKYSLRIKPECSFVLEMFERHPELKDLIVE